MTTYAVKQYCRFVRETHDFRIHAFCLYIDATTAELNDVDEVEYTLHPSFPDPVRTSNDRSHAFAIQSEAWGSFNTYVRILTKKGEIIRLQHGLVLEEDNWPMGDELVKFSSEIERSIYSALSDRKWDWRKLSTVARRAGVTAEDARAVLAGLERKGAARKAAYVHFIDKEELWGATYIVGLLPQPAGLDK
jgi:transcription initiation factor IIF auxiliary subunit